MPSNRRFPAILSSAHARVLTIFLLVQAAVFYGTSRTETPPAHRALAEFPTEISGWRMIQEAVTDKEIQDVLMADDTLERVYVDPGRKTTASMFVAYFKSQRTGINPHSPKNCLPGGGWVPSTSDTVSISIPGRAEPIRVNRYIIAKGDVKSAVLYWYQSRDRVIASEYAAKFYLVADAIRYNRTDTALVRVLVPVAADEQSAIETAIQFAQSTFQPLRSFLPM